jgi:HAD superfamily hydrolase (TIGR01509 family)
MLKPTAGVVDFLSHCKSSNLKCMIVSDGKLANIDSSLDILGIKHLFDGIISHENVDGKKKPSAHPYNLAISSLRNISPQNMIAFEDTAKGITSAKAAGLKCVAILHSSNKKTDLVDADMVISNFNEMQYLFN